mmetsp:Transcript_2718/g.10593  ORF Transcript_2718/g.10593 Transcript_2718/m.10593 type:complete len:225 (-) Transcript_2718:2241-2915(-)
MQHRPRVPARSTRHRRRAPPWPAAGRPRARRRRHRQHRTHPSQPSSRPPSHLWPRAATGAPCGPPPRPPAARPRPGAASDSSARGRTTTPPCPGDSRRAPPRQRPRSPPGRRRPRQVAKGPRQAPRRGARARGPGARAGRGPAPVPAWTAGAERMTQVAGAKLALPAACRHAEPSPLRPLPAPPISRPPQLPEPPAARTSCPSAAAGSPELQWCLGAQAHQCHW